MYKPDVLKNVKIVELATFVAAPAATRMLADWGASVIKVEAPEGDPMRTFGHQCHTPVGDDENPVWQVEGGNKRSITLNLKNPTGKDILLKLLEQADVFVTNTRLRSLQKLGLDYDSLKDRFPRLVWAHMSGYGYEGPDADLPGFDVVSFQARGGCGADLAPAGGAPMSTSSGFGDTITSIALAAGILGGLFKQRCTGRGEKVHVSLYGTAIWTSALMVASCQEKYGDNYPKSHFEPNHPLNHSYKCKDGEWLTLCILNYPRYYDPLMDILGMPELKGDTRFNTIEECNKLENRMFIISALDKAFAQKDREEWCRLLEEADIAYGRVLHYKDVSKDVQAWANNYLYDYEFPNGQHAVLPATPIQFHTTESMELRRAPKLGEHNYEVLRELNLSDAEIESVMASGAMGTKK